MSDHKPIVEALNKLPWKERGAVGLVILSALFLGLLAKIGDGFSAAGSTVASAHRNIIRPHMEWCDKQWWYHLLGIILSWLGLWKWFEILVVGGYVDPIPNAALSVNTQEGGV